MNFISKYSSQKQAKQRRLIALLLLCACNAASMFARAQVLPSDAINAQDAKSFVQFVEDFPTGVCSQRQGKALLMKSTHATRKLRVVLDRYNNGTATADRSRTLLLPNAEPEPLGCSRTDFGTQEWRIVKAEFVE